MTGAAWVSSKWNGSNPRWYATKMMLMDNPIAKPNDLQLDIFVTDPKIYPIA